MIPVEEMTMNLGCWRGGRKEGEVGVVGLEVEGAGVGLGVGERKEGGMVWRTLRMELVQMLGGSR